MTLAAQARIRDEFWVWAPFWGFFTFLAFYPGRFTLSLTILDASLRPYTILFVAVTAYYALLASGCNYSRSAAARPLWLTAMVIAYGLLSLFWSEVSAADLPSMAMVLLFTLVACVLGYSVVAIQTNEKVEAFLGKMTWFVTGVTTIYLLETVFHLGLRSEEGLLNNSFGFSIGRLCGPLYGASIGHQILLPSLGLFMDRLQGTKQTAGAIVCTVGIVMMGSRSAILCLALFGVLGSVRRGGLAAKAVLWTSALIVIYLVVLQTGAERMTDYEDLDRELTRDATWNAVVSNGWGAIWGTGVGGIWPWFGPTGRAVSAIWVTMDSPYGKTLFHPHSVVNLMVGEFGVPGVLYLLALLAILLKFWLRARKGSHFFLATGIVATLPLGLTETIFFKAWEMNAIWWVFLFGALRLVGSREGQRPERRSPPMHHMSGPALRVKIGSEPHPRCHQPRNTAPTEDP